MGWREGAAAEHSVFYKEMVRLFNDGREDKTIARLGRKDLTAQGKWIVAAAAMVQETNGFDVFYLHHHYPDSVIHQYLQAAGGTSRTMIAPNRMCPMAVLLPTCDRRLKPNEGKPVKPACRQAGRAEHG